MHGVVAIIVTADTKASEAEFLRAELTRLHCAVRIVDVGMHGKARNRAGATDVDADAVAAAAGYELARLREHERRDRAMAAMALGTGTVLRRWHAAGQLTAVLGLGGNQGTAIAAAAMRELPFGVPKYLVSTVASGDIRGFVGDCDIVVAFSVADLLGGPNAVTATVLRQAAAAVAGMAHAAPPGPPDDRGRLVAVTAFGNTNGAVTTAMARLSEAGFGSVPFHASGASGSAMERFVAEGFFDGVLDLTTHELLAELFPADIYAPVRPGRMTAAGTYGVPQVIAPGGLEYHCFAAEPTIPEPLRGRAVHHHNPNNTNVRANAEELREVARAMAGRLNAATGPVAVLVPTLGWSEVGSPGGPLHDRRANAEFVAVLRRDLKPTVTLRELPMTINDPRFGRQAAQLLLDLIGCNDRRRQRPPRNAEPGTENGT